MWLKKLNFHTRFAPSPTGPLHLGHAYSALLAFDMAQDAGGAFDLRIEDIDQSRARPKWESQIYDDLGWLGISWPEPVMRQSDRLGVYEAALDTLWADGLLYPCTCTRADIAAAVSAPQEGVTRIGPGGAIYPGTCRNKQRPKLRPKNKALRLDMAQAWTGIDRTLSFSETGIAPALVDCTSKEATTGIGDLVLARRDMGTSYHLSVVLDDAEQGITHVVRGHDLFEATKIHVILQQLLELGTPIYHHHKLIRDEAGKRLAKRDDARAISLYRSDGFSAEDIRELTVS